jgi:hypothetical protein
MGITFLYHNKWTASAGTSSIFFLNPSSSAEGANGLGDVIIRVIPKPASPPLNSLADLMKASDLKWFGQYFTAIPGVIDNHDAILASNAYLDSPENNLRGPIMSYFISAGNNLIIISLSSFGKMNKLDFEDLVSTVHFLP